MTVGLKHGLKDFMESQLNICKNIQDGGELLIHCKTGADRTGLATGIYSLCKQRNDANKAVEHLSIKYLHFGIGNKSILKKFFTFYSEDNHKSLKFKDWAKSQYSTKKFEEYLFNTNTRKNY